MFLVIAIGVAVLVFLSCLFLKRFQFFGLPTPPYVMNSFVGGVSLTIFIINGLGAREWIDTIILLWYVYFGFKCSLSFDDGIASIRTHRQQRTDSYSTNVPSEDHPNWSDYKYRP